MRLLRIALLISTPLLLHAQDPPPPPPPSPAPPGPPPPSGSPPPSLHQDLEQTLLLPPDRAYRKFDTHDYDYPELAASAVSPFCKSFTFLCHLRCLQRATHDPPVLPNTPGDPRAEINRCNGASSMSGSGLKVLCLCSNGVDLTAEVSYALEGVVDIQAAGGSSDGSGSGEAGKIRTVAYVTVTKTVTEVMTRVVTATTTETLVVNTCLPKAGATGGVNQGVGDVVPVVPVVVPVVDDVVDDDGRDGGDALDRTKIRDSEVADEENGDMDDEDDDLFPEYDDSYQDDQDMDLIDAASDQVDGVENDMAGQDRDSMVREDL
ncbi:hypothetical protein BGZ81_001920 [Podila clonocystis]|nr:hypothetical protein BGZ81_001920 [Podila clonocystis]